MRVRPLARREARTALPPRVAMRARKPCFFARLRTLGWNVRFDMKLLLKPLGISPAGITCRVTYVLVLNEEVRLRPGVGGGQTGRLGLIGQLVIICG